MAEHQMSQSVMIVMVVEPVQVVQEEEKYDMKECTDNLMASWTVVGVKVLGVARLAEEKDVLFCNVSFCEAGSMVKFGC